MRHVFSGSCISESCGPGCRLASFTWHTASEMLSALYASIAEVGKEDSVDLSCLRTVCSALVQKNMDGLRRRNMLSLVHKHHTVDEQGQRSPPFMDILNRIESMQRSELNSIADAHGLHLQRRVTVDDLRSYKRRLSHHR